MTSLANSFWTIRPCWTRVMCSAQGIRRPSPANPARASEGGSGSPSCCGKDCDPIYRSCSPVVSLGRRYPVGPVALAYAKRHMKSTNVATIPSPVKGNLPRPFAGEGPDGGTRPGRDDANEPPAVIYGQRLNSIESTLIGPPLIDGTQCF